jgi:hypothetical protein
MTLRLTRIPQPLQNQEILPSYPYHYKILWKQILAGPERPLYLRFARSEIPASYRPYPGVEYTQT